LGIICGIDRDSGVGAGRLGLLRRGVWVVGIEAARLGATPREKLQQ
jgi:hypothetical protein